MRIFLLIHQEGWRAWIHPIPMEELHLFEEAMSSIVEEIGPRYVVQFIINNDSDDSDEIRSIKDMLKKYP